MDCPRDGNQLEHQTFWKHPRDVCRQCLGVFLTERDMAESLGHQEPTEIEDVARVKLDNVKDSALRCPKEGTTMKAVILAGAEIDVCPSCNALWLDEGELKKIQERMRDRIDALRPKEKPPSPNAAFPTAADEATDAAYRFLTAMLLPYRVRRWLRHLERD